MLTRSQITSTACVDLLVEGCTTPAVPSPLENTREPEQGHTHPARADGSGRVIEAARQRPVSQVSPVGTRRAVVARTGQHEVIVHGSL